MVLKKKACPNLFGHVDGLKRGEKRGRATKTKQACAGVSVSVAGPAGRK